MKRIILILSLLNVINLLAKNDDPEVHFFRDESNNIAMVKVPESLSYTPVYQLGNIDNASSLHVIDPQSQNPFIPYNWLKHGPILRINVEDVHVDEQVHVKYRNKKIKPIYMLRARPGTDESIYLVPKQRISPEHKTDVNTDDLFQSFTKEPYNSVWLKNLNYTTALFTRKRNTLIALIAAGVVLTGVAITTIAAIKCKKKRTA